MGAVFTAGRGVGLGEITRCGLGGPADFLVDVGRASLVPEAVRLMAGAGLPIVTLGGGSNLIVADAGFRGIVMRFTGGQLTRDRGTTIAETGAVWQTVVDFHSDLGLTGL